MVTATRKAKAQRNGTAAAALAPGVPQQSAVLNLMFDVIQEDLGRLTGEWPNMPGDQFGQAAALLSQIHDLFGDFHDVIRSARRGE